MKSSIRSTFALLLLAATVARADAVDVSVTQNAQLGKGVPALNIHILEPIAGFEVKLKRSDGKDMLVRGGGRPGDVRKIQLMQPEGTFGYSGDLNVNLPDGSTQSMPLQFDAHLFGPLRMKLDKGDVDVAKRRAVFSINRPAAKVVLKVLAETGRQTTHEVLFNGEPPNTPLEVTWPDVGAKPMMIGIQVHDTFEFFTGVELFPWSFDIPHEEVNFDTGKWDIRPEENAKLDKSVRDISDAVQKFGRWADVKLYVLGHTDTQGSTASNRTLSLNRARSIGAYFKRKGVRIPVLYTGFGEEALKVQTPDETDEIRNRRADYILSIEEPAMKDPPFPPRWQRL